MQPRTSHAADADSRGLLLVMLLQLPGPEQEQDGIMNGGVALKQQARLEQPGGVVVVPQLQEE